LPITDPQDGGGDSCMIGMWIIQRVRKYYFRAPSADHIQEGPNKISLGSFSVHSTKKMYMVEPNNSRGIARLLSSQFANRVC